MCVNDSPLTRRWQTNDLKLFRKSVVQLRTIIHQASNQGRIRGRVLDPKGIVVTRHSAFVFPATWKSYGSWWCRGVGVQTANGTRYARNTAGRRVRIVHHEIASASGNDRPIWLLIDSEAAGPGGSLRFDSCEEVEWGRCRGIDKPPSFIRRCLSRLLPDGTLALYVYVYTDVWLYKQTRTHLICVYKYATVLAVRSAVRLCRRSDTTSLSEQHSPNTTVTNEISATRATALVPRSA